MLKDHHTSGLFFSASLVLGVQAVSFHWILLYVVPGEPTQVFTVSKQLLCSGVACPEPWPHWVLHGQFAVLGFAQPHCFFPGFSSLTTLVNHPEKATEGEELAFPTEQEDFRCSPLAAPEIVRSKEVEGLRQGSCGRDRSQVTETEERVLAGAGVGTPGECGFED